MKPQKPRSKGSPVPGRKRVIKTGPNSRTGKAAGKPAMKSKKSGNGQPRYWLRRLIALVILLLVVVLAVTLVWLLWTGAKATYQHLRNRDNAENSRAVSPEDSVVDPVPCDASMLKLTIKPKWQSIEEDKGMELEGTLKNIGKAPCYVDDGTALASWVITSGDAVITDHTKCSPSTGDRLLLPVDYEWPISWKWDGKNRGADCKSDTVAKAGTYLIKPVTMGNVSEEGITFEVKAPPPPAKKDGDKDSDSKKNDEKKD